VYENLYQTNRYIYREKTYVSSQNHNPIAGKKIATFPFIFSTFLLSTMEYIERVLSTSKEAHGDFPTFLTMYATSFTSSWVASHLHQS
jgi:hypothetical protein